MMSVLMVVFYTQAHTHTVLLWMGWLQRDETKDQVTNALLHYDSHQPKPIKSTLGRIQLHVQYMAITDLMPLPPAQSSSPRPLLRIKRAALIFSFLELFSVQGCLPSSAACQPKLRMSHTCGSPSTFITRESIYNVDDISAVTFDGWLIWKDCLIIYQ